MFRFTKFALALAAFAALGLASAAAANAAPVAFATRADFNTANASRTDITFGTANIDYATSLTFSSVAFNGLNGHTVGVIPGGGLGNYVLNTTGPNGFNVDNLQIALPAGTTAVAFDIQCGNGTQVPGLCAGAYEIYVNGQLFAPSLSTATNGFAFFGVSDTAGISSITIRALSGGPPVLDNFSFAPANVNPEPVPEPATMVLFGTGLAGVASAARRRRLRARKTDED